MSERPKITNSEIRRAAAEKIVAQLIEDSHLEADQCEESVCDIVRYAGVNDDGYEIAKSLDDRAFWSCNFQIAETLDAYGSYLRDSLREAEKEWFAVAALEPPFPIGSRVKFGGRDESGEITGIYEYGAGKFLVAVDGDADANTSRQSRRIVNFEDCRALKLAEARND